MDSLLLTQTKLSNKSPELHKVLSIAVNYIKKNALHSLCFASLCDRLDSGHLQLLYHCEVRWLSKGRVFNRFFKLRQQVQFSFFEFLIISAHLLLIIMLTIVFVQNWPTFQMCLTS